MIVEVHGTDFWTRVRFPPGPLKALTQTVSPKTDGVNEF